jgi:hypothetical protein
MTGAESKPVVERSRPPRQRCGHRQGPGCADRGLRVSGGEFRGRSFMECTDVRAKNLPDARGIPTYFALRVRGSLKRSDFSTALLCPGRDTRRRKKDCRARQSCLCSDRNTHRSLSRRIGAQRRGVSGFLRLPGLTLISSHRASTGCAEARGFSPVRAKYLLRPRQIPPMQRIELDVLVRTSLSRPYAKAKRNPLC